MACRDEDRITKKLVSSLNAFLVADGLNLGDEVVKLHSSFRPFMVRTWLTTRDRDLKVLFVTEHLPVGILAEFIFLM